jgi:hypothetical protein
MRHSLAVSATLWNALAPLPLAQRTRLLEDALALTGTTTRVAVQAPDGRALAPCTPARARQLLRRGRAVLIQRRPPRIALRDPA